MYVLKRSITYYDGSTDNFESIYTDNSELQRVLHNCLVGPKPVAELVITLDKKE